MLYDRNHLLYDAALLTRYYTEHGLLPLIDSETSHKKFHTSSFCN